jgi:UDP-glucose 4-epimerase
VKALITGISGFLGEHVARAFDDGGWQVTGFDLSPSPANFDTIVGDFTDIDQLQPAVEQSDVVLHIGAIGDVYLAGERPGLASSVNVVGTSNVAQAASQSGKRVVYASTWEVYGKPMYEPIDEQHPTRPDHPYNITKLAGESMLLAACELNGLDGVALRLGTAYGSGLRPNSVFRIFLDKARAGEPLTIQGDGSQGRQFTHASDIARAFLLAAQAKASGEAFNVVAPETVTIKELAERIAERFQTELSFGPPRAGDVPPATVSSKRAEEALGWTADVAFDEGLDEFIAAELRRE